MIYLNQGLDYVKVFIDDTAVIGRGTFDKHLEELDVVLQRMENAGLQLNIRKTKWAVDRAEYLGYIVTKEGYSPDPKKIKTLLDIKRPKNKKQIRQFLGSINFYQKMWECRSHLLALLTKLTGDVPFK